MLKDDVMDLLNLFFKKTKIPIKITELFLYRPVYHEPPFENFEPINEAKRLASCDPLFIELAFECDKHSYEYQLRCTNQKGKFLLNFCWLKYCDIFKNEDPKKVETKMKGTVEFLSGLLFKTFELLSRE